MTTSIRAAVPTTTTTTLKGRTKAIMRGSSSFSCNSTKLIRACMRRALSYSSSSSTARHVLETNSSSLSRVILHGRCRKMIVTVLKIVT